MLVRHRQFGLRTLLLLMAVVPPLAGWAWPQIAQFFERPAKIKFTTVTTTVTVTDGGTVLLSGSIIRHSTTDDGKRRRVEP